MACGINTQILKAELLGVGIVHDPLFSNSFLMACLFRRPYTLISARWNAALNRFTIEFEERMKQR